MPQDSKLHMWMDMPVIGLVMNWRLGRRCGMVRLIGRVQQPQPVYLGPYMACTFFEEDKGAVTVTDRVLTHPSETKQNECGSID